MVEKALQSKFQVLIWGEHTVFSTGCQTSDTGAISESFIAALCVQLLWVWWNLIVEAFVHWAINTQGQLQFVIKLDHILELSLGINSPVDEGSNYHNKGPREGTQRLFAVYESWPPYLYACCFSGESFNHGSHLMFSWRLSFNGRSRGCQKFAIAGKTVESQSRGGDMSWPMPCEVRRNRGRSSTSIDLSYTHGSTISNFTCFEQAIFVLLLEAWTPPDGWSIVYYREPIVEVRVN